MSMDPKMAVILFAVLAVIGFIVFVADTIIFIRWVGYLWARNSYEEQVALSMSAVSIPIRPDTIDLTSTADANDGEVSGEGNETLDTSTLPETTSPSPQIDLPFAPEPPFAPTWSLIDPFLGFQFAFIIGQVAVALALFPLILKSGLSGGAADAMSSPMGIFIICLGLVFQNGLFVGVTAFYVHRYGQTMKEIGLKMPTLQQVGIGVGLGLVLFVVVSTAEAGMMGALPHLLPKKVVDFLVEFTKAVTAGAIFNNIHVLPLKILFALAGAIAAPIGEEVFFRGHLYNALKKRIGVSPAIVISGFAFAILHFGPLAIIIIFPMGMLLAYVYEKTQSLWVTICIHATHNGLSFLMAFLMPGLGESKPPAAPVPPPSKHVIVYAMPSRFTTRSIMTLPDNGVPKIALGPARIPRSLASNSTNMNVTSHISLFTFHFASPVGACPHA